MVNTTLSGNDASISGGAIQSWNNTAVKIQNSTVTGNTASLGGGIFRYSGPSITLESSIVSGNSGGGAPDISSAISVTANFSAVGSNAGFPSLTGSNNLPFGADLKLGSLADNGGPTQTHALLPGSAAIDAGSNPMSLPTDQRGIGFARSAGTVDIGATELINLVVRNNNDSGYGSIRQTLQHANSIAGADTITFDPTVFATAQTITLSSGELSIADAVTIVGPGANLATVDANMSSRVFNVNVVDTVATVAISSLTITGGKAGSGGGLLLHDDALTLTECAVVGNAVDSDGGGIHFYGGCRLTV